MYAERRRRFLDTLGRDAVAILQGARPARRSADTDYPFRQDSNFLYYLGLDSPGLAAMLDVDAGTVTVFGSPATILPDVCQSASGAIRIRL